MLSGSLATSTNGLINLEPRGATELEHYARGSSSVTCQ